MIFSVMHQNIFFTEMPKTKFYFSFSQKSKIMLDNFCLMFIVVFWLIIFGIIFKLSASIFQLYFVFFFFQIYIFM